MRKQVDSYLLRKLSDAKVLQLFKLLGGSLNKKDFLTVLIQVVHLVDDCHGGPCEEI